MGCDIHVHVEVFRGGHWVHVGTEDAPDDHPLRKTYSDGGGAYLDWPKDTPYEEQRHAFSDLGSRNYALFALLAGVRNNSGTSRRITPDAPRGTDDCPIPADASAQTRAAFEGWGGDAHTPSWVTVAEVLAFDWNQQMPESGIVSAAQYLEWKRDWKAPNSWCQGTTTPVVENDEIDRLVKAGASHIELSKLSTPLRWYKTARDFGQWFLECCETELCKLADDPAHVRLVFYFDN